MLHLSQINQLFTFNYFNCDLREVHFILMIAWLIRGYFRNQHRGTAMARRMVWFQGISSSLFTTTAYLAYVEDALLASNIH
jgi:hypothetical protein